jgi:hypothetical protein
MPEKASGSRIGPYPINVTAARRMACEPTVASVTPRAGAFDSPSICGRGIVSAEKDVEKRVALYVRTEPMIGI